MHDSENVRRPARRTLVHQVAPGAASGGGCSVAPPASLTTEGKMANAWFRFYSEFEDDPKVQMMSEADQRRLALLFCQRCKEESRTDLQQSFKWRVSLAEVARTKAVFIQNGFIDEDWNLLNWNKRQFLNAPCSDPELRRRGYVYYVADGSQIKIGYSSNPWARVSELRTANPAIEMLTVEAGERSLEKQRHEQFSHLRTTREWFKDDPELRDFVAELRRSNVAATPTEQNRTEQIQSRADMGTPPRANPTPSTGNDGEFMWATWLMDEAGLAHVPRDVEVVAQVIGAEANVAHTDAKGAAEWLLGACQRAMKRGELVNVFWLKDRKYTMEGKDGRSGKSKPSPAKERIDGARRVLAGIAIERGLIDPAGFDGGADAPLSESGPGGKRS